MSLAETQQIMQVLQEIMQLLNNVEIKTTKLNTDLPKIKESLNTLKQVERLALRYLAVVRRMGLSDNVQQQINRLTQLIVTVRMLQISFTALMAGTPIGIITAVGGFALSGFAIYDSIEGY